MEIRPVEEHEVERLRELRLRALLDAPTSFGSSHGAEAGRSLQEWMWWIEPPSVTFVADSGQSWDGLAVGRWDAALELAHVFSMWVAPESRGQGLGAQLLERVIDWAWGSGALTVRLGVTEGNQPAETLYLHRGFQPTGHREVLKSNPHLNCAFMELHRPAPPA